MDEAYHQTPSTKAVDGIVISTKQSADRLY